MKYYWKNASRPVSEDPDKAYAIHRQLCTILTKSESSRKDVKLKNSGLRHPRSSPFTGRRPGPHPSTPIHRQCVYQRSWRRFQGTWVVHQLKPIPRIPTNQTTSHRRLYHQKYGKKNHHMSRSINNISPDPTSTGRQNCVPYGFRIGSTVRSGHMPSWR